MVYNLPDTFDLKEDLVEVAEKCGISRWVKVCAIAAVSLLVVFALTGCSLLSGPRVEGGKQGATKETSPTVAGLDPTGVDKEASDVEGRFTFKIDEAYTAGADTGKTCVYTNEEGTPPLFKMSVVENVSNKNLEEVASSLIDDISATYRDRTDVIPTVTYVDKDGRQIAHIDYEFFFDSRSSMDKFMHVEENVDERKYYKGLILTELHDGFYYSWFGVFLTDDTATPAAMEHASDTMQYAAS